MKSTKQPNFNPSARIIPALILAAISGLYSHQQASAATFTYTNSEANTSPGTNWSDATNWNATPASATNTNLVLTGALTDGVALFSNNNIAGDFRLNKMDFTHTGPDTGTTPTFTLSGNPLEFVSNGTTSPAISFNTTGVIKPTVVIHNNLVLTNNLNVSANSPGMLYGAISGPGNLKKSTGSDQTLTLAGANSYTGLTTIATGTLAGVGAHAFGSTSGISIAGSGILSLRGDSNTAFTKANDDTGYAVTTTADGATIDVDQATSAGTEAKTMSIGPLTINTAVTNATHFTGANHTSLSIGAVTTGNSTGGTETLDNSNVGGGSLTLASIAVLRAGSPILKFDGAGHTIVSGAITEVSTTALYKSGTGTLELSDHCGLTGLATLNKGTIHLTGSLTSDVSVKNTGTLSGTGSISGNLTVSSSGHLAFAIAANPTAQDPLDITGTLTMESGIIDLSVIETTPVNGNYILATASGVTHPLSSTVNLGSINGTVSIIDNNLVLTVTGSPNTYENWAASPYGLSGGNAAFDFDFDHDGIDNGLEWILGGNPANGLLSVNPKAIRDTSGNLILTFTREEDSIGKATLTLEYGNSLANWNSFTIDTDGGTDPNGASVNINQTAEPDAVTITIPAPTGRIFARLKAVKSP